MENTIPLTHTETVVLQSYHCDRTDHLSLWGLCRIFQEASAHHTDGTPLGYSELLSEGKAWVLSRMYYEMHQMPMMNEGVRVSTWSRGTNGIFAVREFQMHDPQGNLCCSASTYWVVIDMRARHVCRIADLMKEFPVRTDFGTSLENVGKLRLGAFADSDHVADVPANDSFIDHTQHVNNAEYIRLMSDYFNDAVAEGRWVTESDGSGLSKVDFRKQSRFDNFCFQIDYPMETRPGETLSVFRKRDGDATCFQISNSRGVSVVARFLRL